MAVLNQTEPALTLVAVDNGVRSTAEFVRDSHQNERNPVIPVKVVPYEATKRVFDCTVIVLFSIVIVPVGALIALLVKLTSKGPIIFKQTRVGVGGRQFTCFKFRSMVMDAEARKQKLDHLNEVSGPVFKMKNDPRVTPIGKFIRKLSLDELPQLWNVLIGDMSLVGPRPPVPAEVEHYGPRELGRLAVKPGLTCLWQISGRSNIPFEHWVELDLIYIDQMTFKSDFMILLKTIPAVLTGRGAQ